MIPSAKSDNRSRLPPEKRFRKPRTLEPPKWPETSEIAWALTPGDGMQAPRR